jgi:hypothetical protein
MRTQQEEQLANKNSNERANTRLLQNRGGRAEAGDRLRVGERIDSESVGLGRSGKSTRRLTRVLLGRLRLLGRLCKLEGRLSTRKQLVGTV